jgi:hypothetical protein
MLLCAAIVNSAPLAMTCYAASTIGAQCAMMNCGSLIRQAVVLLCAAIASSAPLAMTYYAVSTIGARCAIIPCGRHIRQTYLRPKADPFADTIADMSILHTQHPTSCFFEKYGI